MWHHSWRNLYAECLDTCAVCVVEMLCVIDSMPSKATPIPPLSAGVCRWGEGCPEFWDSRECQGPFVTASTLWVSVCARVLFMWSIAEHLSCCSGCGSNIVLPHNMLTVFMWTQYWKYFTYFSLKGIAWSVRLNVSLRIFSTCTVHVVGVGIKGSASVFTVPVGFI